MQHIALTPFGRGPATLAQVAASSRAPAPCPAIDKWLLFSRVRTARARLGVTDRDLGVLYALLSFLPSPELRDSELLVVFPSNAKLSDRAHGMPESTLRRHLAALICAGLIARRDSPNGKRYAAKSRTGALLAAYGFDLRPLLLRAPIIEAEAQAAEAEALALDQRRNEAVVALRDATKLAALLSRSDLVVRLDEARTVLRRRLAFPELNGMAQALSALVDELREHLLSTEEVSGTDGQNERHQQSQIKKDHDSVSGREDGEPTARPDLGDEAVKSRSLPTDAPPPRAAESRPISLTLVVKACPELLTYAPAEPRTWRELGTLAGTLRSYMGIASSLWHEAQLRMGLDLASATLAVMLQRFSTIRNPGGYLRRLVQRHTEGRLNLGSMIFGLLRQQERAG